MTCTPPILASWPCLSYFTLFSLLIICQLGCAQNLESIGQEKPVHVSGGIQFTSTGYAAQGIAARRAPFTWIASGNFNLDLYGWNVPLSFSYTNHQSNFQQPFNRYGISPYYKWVKAHLGYHSLIYSSYTLNGHVFLGAGMELTPGNFRLHAMYGRFQQATEADTTAGYVQPPVFTRRGMAVKLGYENAQGGIHAIVFYAHDDPESLLFIPDSLQVFPEQNVVLSLIAKKQLGKRLTWDGEWANSLLTRNQNAARLPDRAGMNAVGALLMPIRQSTTQQQALKTGLRLALSKGFLQGQYERVDPDYQTLGSYFFNNDLENITLGIGWQFWQDRLNINIQSGLQHNNLDQTEISQTRRWVSNYSLNFHPADRWQFTTTYSNFTSFTNIRPTSDPFFSTEFDSLNYYQINQNASLTTTYSFGNKDRKSALTFNSTYQQAQEASQDGVEANNASYYYSTYTSYRISMIPNNLSMSLGGNLYHHILEEINTTTVGPLLSVNKSLMEKKIRSAFSLGFNQVLSNQTASSQVLTSRLSTAYSPNENHRLSLNLNLLNNFPVEQQASFTEWTAVARYGYTF